MTRHRTDLVFLDVVRGFSAQAVVLGHALTIAFPAFWAQQFGGGRIGARSDYYYMQSHAVVAFLALSGYLITMSVARRVRADSFVFRDYMLDRFTRIFLPLLPAFVLVLVLDRWVLGKTLFSPFVVVVHGLWETVGNALMLQDNRAVRLVDQVLGTDLEVRSLGSAAPWWTVAYEWWIYVAFAVAVSFVLGRRWWRPLLLVLGGFSFATVLGVLASGNGLALAWLVGFAFAWWEPRLAGIGRLQWAGVALASAGAMVGWLVLHPHAVYSFVVSIATAVLIFALHHLLGTRLLVPFKRLAAFFADYAYSLYLLHFSFLVWLHALAPDLTGYEFLAVGLALSNITAWVWWWLIERHYPRVRTWFRRRPAAETAA